MFHLTAIKIGRIALDDQFRIARAFESLDRAIDYAKRRIKRHEFDKFYSEGAAKIFDKTGRIVWSMRLEKPKMKIHVYILWPKYHYFTEDNIQAAHYDYDYRQTGYFFSLKEAQKFAKEMSRSGAICQTEVSVSGRARNGTQFQLISLTAPQERA